MNKIIYFLKGKYEFPNIGLLVLRIIAGYFLITDHGWSKITHPENWARLGGVVTKYFGGMIDSLSPMFGFLAAFSETVGAALVIFGLFTQPASILICGTMSFAALSSISRDGSPEKALIYFAIFAAIAIAGPGKYSIQKRFLSKSGD